MKRSLLIVVGMLLASGQALAAEYGTAGCGLGAMAFKDQPGKIQIVAATLNNLVSPQTSAITSGTSSCYESVNTASAMFIEVNEQALRKDISRGNGESLAGLSQLLNCQSSEKLGATLQRNYGAIFSNENDTAMEISDSIKNTIRNDRELAGQCSV